ncbi:MAG: hypothetical protein OJF49_000923 [Ktedonobacterales bacterium]|nr:MAG: hypothetical protein OJF49_000923 [Ktedonobacterales bacterium]
MTLTPCAETAAHSVWHGAVPSLRVVIAQRLSFNDYQHPTCGLTQ